MQGVTRAVVRSVFLVGILLLAACNSLPVGEYTLDAYRNATELKAETLALVARSSQSYRANATAVEALGVRIDAAYEFAAGSANNQLSARQWSLMRDPGRNLFGGFVRFWAARGSLSPAFRDEYSILIGEAFDYIICLEANKRAQTMCRPPSDGTAT